jgi:RNA ligase
LSPYKAVKVKQADYVELHRIVTGLNRKAVWRTLRDGTFRENIVHLPDELYKWAEEVAAELLRKHAAIKQEARDWLRKLSTATPTSAVRKDHALWVIQNIENPAMRGLVFLLLDGQSLDEKVWVMIEPRGDGKE